jgi:hypothetical protein
VGGTSPRKGCSRAPHVTVVQSPVPAGMATGSAEAAAERLRPIPLMRTPVSPPVGSLAVERVVTLERDGAAALAHARHTQHKIAVVELPGAPGGDDLTVVGGSWRRGWRPPPLSVDQVTEILRPRLWHADWKSLPPMSQPREIVPGATSPLLVRASMVRLSRGSHSYNMLKLGVSCGTKPSGGCSRY